MRGRAILFLLTFGGAGCATIMQGTVQEVPVSSMPSGATVIVDGGPRFKTPTTLILSRKDAHKIELSLEGYYPQTIDLRPVTSGAVAGNIIAGGLVGWAIDNSSGGQYRLVPEAVHFELRRRTEESPNKAAEQP